MFTAAPERPQGTDRLVVRETEVRLEIETIRLRPPGVGQGHDLATHDVQQEDRAVVRHRQVVHSKEIEGGEAFISAFDEDSFAGERHAGRQQYRHQQAWYGAVSECSDDDDLPPVGCNRCKPCSGGRHEACLAPPPRST